MNGSRPIVWGVIPARLASRRLPRKMLLDQTGKPLIQHTWEAASRAASLDRLIIATDSPQIASVARSFGACCVLTGEHPSGTDRIAEVVRQSSEPVDVVVNIQGDEPEIDPGHIDLLVHCLSRCPAAPMATLATPIRTACMLDDPSCTKVVCASDGRALYFSRSCIPHVRDGDRSSLLQQHSPWLLHLGIYALRRDFLLQLASLPPSRLERLERLEQLRALEAGARIQVATVPHHAPGIDTPEDYAAFVSRQRRVQSAA